jgi:hypothetical protein
MSFFKVSKFEFSRFVVDYYSGLYPHQRLGQAFHNEFCPLHQSMNAHEKGELNGLFYCEDNVVSLIMIMENYLRED